MCGAEGLLLALKLASELIATQPEPYHSFSTPSVCICCTGSEPERLRCRADQMEDEQRAVRLRNIKVKEFEQMTRMCLAK